MMLRWLKDLIYGLTTQFFISTILRMPYNSSVRLGEKIGAIAHRFSTKTRSIQNLTQRLGVDEKTAKEILDRNYRNLGKNLAEFARFSTHFRDSISQNVQLDGKDQIDLALKNGNGVIILTGHFGNWELLAATLVANGYRLHAIARKIRSKTLDKFVEQQREKAGYFGLDRDRAARCALKTLRRNELLGILADVDTTTNGVFVNFFDRLAHTPSGPIAIAQKTGAVVLPTFIVRHSDNSHKIFVEEPLKLDRTDNAKADLITNTQRFTSVIESYVKRYPDQWIWMHDRWKTRPNDKNE